jgi:hypothetical protein
VTTSRRDTLEGYSGTRRDWVEWAAVMLGLVGIFNVIDGIVALSKSKFYVSGAKYVFSDLRTWGWIVLALGIVEILAALYVVRGSELARWVGVAAAAINGIGQLLFLPAYPLWSLAAFTIDTLVIYALVVYGGSRARLRA